MRDVENTRDGKNMQNGENMREGKNMRGKVTEQTIRPAVEGELKPPAGETGNGRPGKASADRYGWQKAYLHDRRGVLGIYALFLLLFLMICLLYRLPGEAVLYWAALCLAAAVPVCAVDCRRYAVTYRALRKREADCAMLCGRAGSFESGESDEFGEPGVRADGIKAGTAIEREYQRLLHLAAGDRKRLEGEWEARRGELLDYYTVWVHQIKTPISAMHLLLQSEETSQSGELSEQLFHIEEYVNMALQYLRLDGEHDLVIAVCDLDRIVRQSVRKYARVFVRKKLSLTYRPVHCQVLTDEKWLTFAIEQLLSNALKYTKEGGISIYLDPDREKTLVISDTGIGIAAEDQPRIFEKGFTGYNGREDKKATGLGLYLCRQALNLLSHTVEVESEPGVGTKMRLNLATEDLTVE